MPFGLAGAPSSFCRLMSIVLKDLLWEICLCYLDDIVLYARTQEELIDKLKTVLDRLRQVGLKVKPSKCALFKENIRFLLYHSLRKYKQLGNGQDLNVFDMFELFTVLRLTIAFL